MKGKGFQTARSPISTIINTIPTFRALKHNSTHTQGHSPSSKAAKEHGKTQRMFQQNDFQKNANGRVAFKGVFNMLSTAVQYTFNGNSTLEELSIHKKH